MRKRLKIKISRILSFKFCGSKKASSLPINPVPSSLHPTPLDVVDPPRFKWKREGKWHVIAQVNEEETPRRKIYDRRRSTKKERSSISSSAEEEETDRESLLPARLSSFVERLMSCTTETAVMVEGVAVVKRSKDPYEDFKGSMMEMIVEKKMFQVAELEQLLTCFLSLNAQRHHPAIIRAFSQIWVALFAGGSSHGGAHKQ